MRRGVWDASCYINVYQVKVRNMLISGIKEYTVYLLYVQLMMFVLYIYAVDTYV